MMKEEFATQADAYREMVVNMGQDRPDHCWILTPYDTWERNPAYQGPPQPHPEDDYHLMDIKDEDGNMVPSIEDDPRFYPSEECGDDGMPF